MISVAPVAWGRRAAHRHQPDSVIAADAQEDTAQFTGHIRGAEQCLVRRRRRGTRSAAAARSRACSATTAGSRARTASGAASRPRAATRSGARPSTRTRTSAHTRTRANRAPRTGIHHSAAAPAASKDKANCGQSAFAESHGNTPLIANYMASGALPSRCRTSRCDSRMSCQQTRPRRRCQIGRPALFPHEKARKSPFARQWTAQRRPTSAGCPTAGIKPEKRPRSAVIGAAPRRR